MTRGGIKSRFDNSGDSQSPYTATISTVLRAAMRAHSRALRVCLPAQIMTIHSDFSVDVMPGFLEQHGQSPVPTPMPLLPNVPVAMPHGAKFSVRYPLTVGDTGYVLIADRCIDAWLAGSGAPADPADGRTHDLTDAIFVPGLLTSSASAAAQDGSSDMVLRSGLAALRLQQGGKFTVSNGTAELLAQVQSLANQVSALAGFVAGGVVPPGGGSLTFSANPTAAATAKTQATAIAGAVGTLKGS